MKKHLLISVLALACAAAQAGMTAKQCSQVADLARVVMEARQQGATAPQILAVSGDLSDNPLYTKMVMDAFEVPQTSSKAKREALVKDYSMNWRVKCAKYAD